MPERVNFLPMFLIFPVTYFTNGKLLSFLHYFFISNYFLPSSQHSFICSSDVFSYNFIYLTSLLLSCIIVHRYSIFFNFQRCYMPFRFKVNFQLSFDPLPVIRKIRNFAYRYKFDDIEKSLLFIARCVCIYIIENHAIVNITVTEQPTCMIFYFNIIKNV